MKLSEILPMLGDIEFKIKNERSFEFLSLCEGHPDFACCVFIESAKYVESIPKNAVMVLAPHELEEALSANENSYGVCFVNRPRIVFFELHNYLSNVDGYRRPQTKTTMGKNCKISPISSIAENNVVIGDDVTIEEFVVVRENTIIGDRSIIRAGTIVGGQGFEFKRHDNKILGVEHTGGVIIGSDVEIQHNNCIDRAIYPWDNTVIGNFSKTDNLVHIAHATKIGENVLIASCSMIAGRTEIKNNTWIGPGVVISNAIKVGENSRINIGAVVARNVKDGASMTGNFAIPHNKFLHNYRHSLRDVGRE
jgi:UDP-3-O-[3-hydroxymyristoyl] glucosamine N-acyltransferase